VFLDRDGTIIEDTGFIRRVEDVHLLPGAVDGLRALQSAGFVLVVVSNQSGLARGIMAERELNAVHGRFENLLRESGITVRECLYCPNHPNGAVEKYRRDCADRKGAPGMILKAAHRHGIDLPGSWMIGDREGDLRAGRACGMRTIRIGQPGPGEPAADFSADNLWEASRIILGG